MGRGFTQHNVVCIFYRKKAGKGLGDLHTNEGACFCMHCSVYQIKTIETKGREYPCLEYAASLSVHQKVGGRLWVMSYVSLGNTIEIHFIRDFLTTILLMWFLCLLFCDCCMWSHNRGNSNHTEDLVQRSDMEMKDKARYKHFDPMWNIFLQNSCQRAWLCLFVHQNAEKILWMYHWQLQDLHQSASTSQATAATKSASTIPLISTST